jgi:hypothetical protein
VAGVLRGSVPAAFGWGLLFAGGSLAADFFSNMARLAFEDVKPYGKLESPQAVKGNKMY